MSEFNTPSHYVLSDGSDSMDALAKILGPEEFKGFLRGNAIKYLIRYKLKGGIDDLKKAMDYIDRLLAVESGHSHDIKIPPHRFFDQKDGGHSHDIKIPLHCNFVKKEEEECSIDPINHDLMAEMEAMRSKCRKAQILCAILIPEDKSLKFKDEYEIFKMLVGVVGDMQQQAEVSGKDESAKKAKKYTKKPLAIEAIKYDKKNIGRLQNFCDKLRYNPHDNEYYIERSNGCKKVVDGDFVIKGINGEFYPCKADFFEKTYEPMTSEELSKTE